MKKIFFLQLFLIAVDFLIFISCQKEISWDLLGNINKPPIAIAGPDQVITLPTDSISLDGNASSDPDGKISEWRWKKIEDPASFNVANPSNAKTVVRSLTARASQVELKIKDDEGLQAKDTMQVTVDDPRIHQSPIASAGPHQSIILPTNSINKLLNLLL